MKIENFIVTPFSFNLYCGNGTGSKRKWAGKIQPQ
jgi:hypothetical protein